jgi:sterol desaturase/sphingolipid hydroxylase (fatty acid hydroxylase superfamily)
MNPTIETTMRLAAFTGGFALMALSEVLGSRRRLSLERRRRWPGNLGILIVDALVVRLLLPSAAVGAAVIAADQGLGLFTLTRGPLWLAGILGFVVLDLTIYLQHVVFHRVPLLWRIHRMHHADLDIDVTTGLRFHPCEILLSLLIKIATIVLIGIPPLAVLIFEVVLNASSMFNHANVAMPVWLDRMVRLLVVTPDMHRVHHSVVRAETDSNFGFNLPWWDRLFGTYRAEPQAGHIGMTIGLPNFRDPRELGLARMLVQPLRGETAAVDGAKGADGH